MLKDIYLYIDKIIKNSSLAKSDAQKKGKQLIDFTRIYFDEWKSEENKINYIWFLYCVSIGVFKSEYANMEYSMDELIRKQKEPVLVGMLHELAQ